MRKPPPWLLLGAAAIALSVAVAQIAQRRALDPANIAARQQQTVQKDIAARKAELERDRAGIIARIRELYDARNYAGAMELAGRYYIVQDPEVYALYRQAAAAESDRQNIAEARDLVVKQCTEERVSMEAEKALVELGVPAGAVRKNDLRLARLDAPEAAAAIVAELRADRPGVSLEPIDANAPPHFEHRAMVRSEYAKALQSGNVDEGLVCAWRITASPTAADLRGLDLVLWLAPQPAGKDVRAEALSYSPPRNARKAAPAHKH